MVNKMHRKVKVTTKQFEIIGHLVKIYDEEKKVYWKIEQDKGFADIHVKDIEDVEFLEG